MSHIFKKLKNSYAQINQVLNQPAAVAQSYGEENYGYYNQIGSSQPNNYLQQVETQIAQLNGELVQLRATAAYSNNAYYSLRQIELSQQIAQLQADANQYRQLGAISQQSLAPNPQVATQVVTQAYPANNPYQDDNSYSDNNADFQNQSQNPNLVLNRHQLLMQNKKTNEQFVLDKNQQRLKNIKSGVGSMVTSFVGNETKMYGAEKNSGLIKKSGKLISAANIVNTIFGDHKFNKALHNSVCVATHKGLTKAGIKRGM